LLGDAASLVHPFTGEGISFAVESGRMAAEVLSDDRIPEADKGRVYEKQVLRRVRPAFLSFDKFAAIRLPMLLPRPLGNALVNAAALAQRLTGRRARPLGIVAQAGTLIALAASLLAFWAAHVLGRQSTGSPYGLRATLFASLMVAFCLLHARSWQGMRFAWLFFGVTFTFSLAAEALGSTTGFVFGAYAYGPEMPAKIFGLVPAVVPVMWFVVSYLSFAAAHAFGVRPIGMMATALLVAYDLVTDPNHVHRGGWSYVGGGSYYGVPVQNFAAWFVFGQLCFAVLEPLRRRWGRNDSPDDLSLPVTAYALVILHESVFAFGISGHAGPGVVGLAVLAGVLALWSRSRPHARRLVGTSGDVA
jgi:putative membrane protein